MPYCRMVGICAWVAMLFAQRGYSVHTHTLAHLIVTSAIYKVDALLVALSEACPSLPPACMPDGAAPSWLRRLRRPANTTDKVVRCSQLHGPRVLLVGDPKYVLLYVQRVPCIVGAATLKAYTHRAQA